MSISDLRDYKPSLDKPIYRGSVQNLHALQGHDDLIISETTAGGSVFDVGTIFHIKDSDTARTGFRHYIFRKLADPNAWQEILPTISTNTSFGGKRYDALLATLCKHGAYTHHLGMIDPESWQVYPTSFPPQLSRLTLLKNLNINKPKFCNVGKTSYYDYSSYQALDRFVIPLEYIVRFGITRGSSILTIYEAMQATEQKHYLKELGLKHEMKPWMSFNYPINDFTTKYEPSDRRVSNQEAALISCLSGEMFGDSIMLANLASFMVHQVFKQMGLNLWDLKWEMAQDNDSLIFVDTIDTDSVRATLAVKKGPQTLHINFNKQSMRDYYQIQHADWYAAVLDAKTREKTENKPFNDILKAGQADQSYPQTPEVDPDFLAIQQNKFEFVCDFILAQNKAQDFRQQALDIAQAEIQYYVKAKRYEHFAALTAIA